MNDLDFIVGLMKQDRDAVGFIPSTTIERRYVSSGLYVAQYKLGKPVGYILHGVPKPYGQLTIAQALIDFDNRENGYAKDAFETVLERARYAGCRSIKLRCAEDLAAGNAFWLSLGFERTKTEYPANARRRAIHTYLLGLQPSLFDILHESEAT